MVDFLVAGACLQFLEVELLGQRSHDVSGPLVCFIKLLSMKSVRKGVFPTASA